MPFLSAGQAILPTAYCYFIYRILYGQDIQRMFETIGCQGAFIGVS